ncbi:hypothetical protein XBKQ1_470006 [Xenorhabdus bovienii str. kraussei Quebec]|uniref:Uncharacterized protein n=1 Tax=Xenorhabdus bovienii str. kraussei Quebec TaxID=1398203 RepID=A0A077PNQ1_XENBV|nr:hypothetical protein XBKQ1_470006 [Xenorhabdus bovienii str. kraussei Quebec]
MTHLAFNSQHWNTSSIIGSVVVIIANEPLLKEQSRKIMGIFPANYVITFC